MEKEEKSRNEKMISNLMRNEKQIHTLLVLTETWRSI